MYAISPLSATGSPRAGRGQNERAVRDDGQGHRRADAVLAVFGAPKRHLRYAAMGPNGDRGARGP